MEWPSDGQACSIPSCPSGEHVFHKIGSYRAHFIKFHKEFVPVYYCPKEGCSFRAFKITPIRKHWDKKHPGLQGEMCLEQALTIHMSLIKGMCPYTSLESETGIEEFCKHTLSRYVVKFYAEEPPVQPK
uniref:Uncharacterized protein n=1 Tax=Magallana gigas TaxID=29159 RepID=K1RCY3_MAGGI